MDGLPLLDEFYQVQVDLQDVVHQIYQLTNSNIRERALLEKDFVNLVELMRETLATARVTVGFIRLIFNMDSLEEKDSSGIHQSRSSKEIETSGEQYLDYIQTKNYYIFFTSVRGGGLLVYAPLASRFLCFYTYYPPPPYLD